MKISGIFSLLLLITVWQPAQAQWRQDNGPYGGDVRVLAISADSTTLFAGTWDKHFFRSGDHGTSWTEIDLDGANPPRVTSIALHETYTLVGTSDGRIFRSTDNGETWTQTTSTNLKDCEITSIIVAYNGEGGTSLFVGGSCGVNRSTDDGTTWTWANQGLTGGGVLSLTSRGAILLAGTGGGVFRSTNSGVSWVLVDSSMTDRSLCFAARVSDTAHALLFAHVANNGFFRSTNGGSSWSKVSSMNFAVTSFSVGSSEGKEVLYLGTLGSCVIQSADSGAHWTWPSIGMSNPDVYAVAACGTEIYAGTRGSGVFRSTDAGIHWRPASSGLVRLDVSSLAASDSNVFAGTYFGGVHRATMAGPNWTLESSGMWNPRILAVAVSPNPAGGTDIFASTSGSRIMRSTDCGASWTYAGGGLTSNFANCLASIPDVTGGAYLLAGMANSSGLDLVFKSTDAGGSWSSASSGITALRVDALTYASDSAGVVHLVAGSLDGGVFHSIDGGITWAQRDTSMRNTSVGTLAVNPRMRSLFAGTEWGVFISTDHGTNWALTTLTDSILSLAVDTSETGEVHLFAATSDRIFLSMDNGENWKRADSGLVNVNVRCLGFSPAGSNVRYLLAGTSSGVWRRQLSEMITSIGPDGNDLPAQFALEQNYPNPFNPTTTIRYQLPVASQVRLAVYDLLGREVATLVNERKEAGVHEVKFDAGALSSDVYFYRLETGGFVQVKKLIFLK